MNFNSENIYGDIILDSSIKNNHGINNGVTHNPISGFNGGGAYNFDAIDDYIMLDDQGDTFAKSMCDNGCSMCVWAKPEYDNHDNWQYIFGRFDTTGTGGLLVLHGVQSATGTLTMTMYGAGESDSVALTASSGATLEAWNYICYVYDGSNTTLGNTMIYNNGVLLETSATQIQINSSY